MTVKYVPADKTLKDARGREVDLERLLKISGLKMEVCVCAVDGGAWEFELSYDDHKGHTVASYSFDINPQSKRMDIEEASATGYGTLVFTRLLNLIDKLGVERVEAKASDVGGFFWGRIGMLPQEHEITKLEEEIHNRGINGISLKTPDEFRKFVSSDNAKWALVDTEWHGYLDIGDEKQMQFCREYIGLKASARS